VKIEIQTTQMTHRTITTKAGGSADLFEQDAYLHKEGEPYPQKFRITHRQNVPLSPGFYSLSDSSFTVGRWGDISLDTFRIAYVPIVAPSEPVKPLFTAASK
jgi:hypothetical protein